MISQKIAENRILEALERGEFENLPGRGKAVDLTEYFSAPPELRAVFDLLKNQGIRPREVDLLNLIGNLRSKLKETADLRKIQHLKRQLNDKMTELNIILESHRKY